MIRPGGIAPWIVAGASLTAAAGVPLMAVPACAGDGGLHAGVVVRFSSTEALHRCVSFLAPDREISGIEALQRTGLPVVTLPFGTLGEFVCKIGDVGTEASGCEEQSRRGNFWAYFRLGDAGWYASPLGASAARVGCGDVEGWAWQSGGTRSPPPPAALAGICGPEACPPAGAGEAPAGGAEAPDPGAGDSRAVGEEAVGGGAVAPAPPPAASARASPPATDRAQPPPAGLLPPDLPPPVAGDRAPAPIARDSRAPPPTAPREAADRSPLAVGVLGAAVAGLLGASVAAGRARRRQEPGG